MKKLVVLAASILLCTFAQAQGASDSGTSAGITIIPRIDFNPIFYDGDDNEVTLGNSSLYTLFEGNLFGNLSFSVCNHWLSADPKLLYENTWRSDDVNWLDWAYLEYSLGNFTITAGKDMVTMGGFEFDDYDFDVHPDMLSGLWNNFPSYQWGGKVGYTTDDERTGLSFQVVSSPYGERPFDAVAYSLQYLGNYGPFSMMYSTNLVGDGEGGHEWLLTLGHRLETESWTYGLDVSNKVGDPFFILRDGVTAFGSATYTPGEKWQFIGRCGLERATSDLALPGLGMQPIKSPSYTGWTFGGAAHWFPLKDSQDLRLHAAAAYNSHLGFFSLNLGATYYFKLPRNR